MPSRVYYEAAGSEIGLVIAPEEKDHEVFGPDITAGEFYRQFQQFLFRKKPKGQNLARQFFSAVNKAPPWVRRARNEVSEENSVSPARPHASDDSFEEMKEGETPEPSIDEFVDVWISPAAVTSVELLRTKVAWNYYYRMDDFLQDANALFLHTLRRCNTSVRFLFWYNPRLLGGQGLCERAV